MIKSHGCGDLRAAHSGSEVTLAGWVNAHRDHGGVLFLDLRDASGVVQVVCEAEGVAAIAHQVRDEWCLLIKGTVRDRPQGTLNPKLPTGDVEVAAGVVEVLSECPPLPFPVTDEIEAEEATRLRYRYIDLRRQPMQEKMALRSKARKAIRDHFEEHNFIEIETPIMTRATPEGARDFIVPSRHHRGKVFALAQSPQLYKQTLMVGGIERYYQLAPSFRDEDPRADRQIEFVQLDFEMAFVERNDVLELMEGLMSRMWRDCLGVEIEVPFARIDFDDAIARYGTDRPDIREAAGPTVVDLSAVFAGTSFNAFGGVLSGGGAVRGLRVPGAGADASRATLDGLIDRAKELGAKGLVWMVVEPNELRATITKFLSEGEIAGIRRELGAENGDLLLLAADEPRLTSEILGTLRVELARSQGRIRSIADPEDWRFVWVLEMPAFEWSDEDDAWISIGNPFYAPTPETLPFLDSDPASVRTQQYDLVINGTELLSGSIRMHRADMQRKVFQILGLTDQEIEDRFGWFVEALSHGAPPHGGVGMGLDRTLMAMTGGGSLRDIIAFPKTQTGVDPLTGAPAPVDPVQLRDLGLRLTEKEQT
ncbi:MAG: aspartate--tRNA ligase [Actinomycetota bacterium]